MFKVSTDAIKNDASRPTGFFRLILPFLMLLLLSKPGQAGDELSDGEALLARLTTSLASGSLSESESIALSLNTFGKDWAYRSDFVVARHFVNETSDTKQAETLLVGLLDRYSLIHDQVLYYLARVLVMNGRSGPAASVLQRLRAEYPESPLHRTARLFMAELELEQGRPADAVLSLVPLVSNRYRVEDNEIRLLLVKAFIALDQISEARDMLKDIVIHAPGTDEALLASSILDALGGYELTFDQRLNRAKNLARFRKYDEAANEYQSLLSESPGDPSITDALGRALFSSRQYDRAGEILAKADTAENAYIEVRSLYRSGDQDGFLRRLEEAEAKYPELHGRLYRLKLARAQDLRRAKAFSKAEPLFNQLLDTYPDERSSTLWELGWSQFLRGDHESASATFLQLASVDASNDLDRSLYWLARSYEKLGRSGDAATLFKRISEEFQETYYGTLTRSFLENKPVKGNRPPPPRLPEAGAFLRINELRLVGLLPDARRELNDLASEIKTMEEAQAFARLAADVQDFSRAIQVAEPLSRFNPDFEFVAYPRGFWTNIEEAADREDLDPYLIASVIRKESRFDPRAYSSAGAMGLMQLMPSTARSVSHRAGVPLDSESALFEPEPNIRIGAHYLAGLVREYDRNIVLAVAAYNAGRSAVSMWLDRKVPVPADEFIEEISYPETRNYVKHVIKNYIHYRELWGLTPPSLSAMVGSSEPAKL